MKDVAYTDCPAVLALTRERGLTSSVQLPKEHINDEYGPYDES